MGRMTSKRARNAGAFLAGSALLGGLAVPSSASAQPDGQPDPEPPVPPDVAARIRVDEPVTDKPKFIAITQEGGPVDRATAVALRAAYNLDTSEAALAAAEQAAVLDPTVREVVGVPLTPDEVLEVKRHQMLDGYVLTAQTALSEEWPERFAGIAIDHSRGGDVTVWMKSPDGRDNIAGLFPKTTNLTIVPVEKSLQELEKSSEEINRALDGVGWRPNGVPVHGVAINLELNAVEVLVEPSMAALAPEVLSWWGQGDLRVALKDAIEVTPVGNTDAAAAGGQNLALWENGAVYREDTRCSSAFPVIHDGSVARR